MLVGAFMLMIEEKDLLLFVVAALVAYAAFSPLRPNALSAVRMSLFATSVVLVVVHTLFGIAKAFRGSEHAWIGTVVSPPTNQDATTEGVRWAADRLRHHGVDCVVDMSNNGVINGLLERPSCSRITYPVYAVKTHEPELIAAVRQRGPNAVLFRSTHWAYSIDGKPMDSRFPELNRYLLSAYSDEECAHGYCIRYR